MRKVSVRVASHSCQALGSGQGGDTGNLLGIEDSLEGSLPLFLPGGGPHPLLSDEGAELAFLHTSSPLSLGDSP